MNAQMSKIRKIKKHLSPKIDHGKRKINFIFMKEIIKNVTSKRPIFELLQKGSRNNIFL